jgi:toxin-antitoxin system PIN domain toxin
MLMALAWPNHLFHEAAHRWFGKQRSDGWATCALTQAAFVRLSAQPAVVKTTITVAQAITLLLDNIAAPEHQYWPATASISEMRPDIRARIMGHNQVMDAILLDLAIRRGGRLATLDRRLRVLIAAEDPDAGAVEVVSVDA